MTIAIIKFFHFAALFAAGGIGVGGAIVQTIYVKEGKVPEPHLSKALKILGFVGLGSIIILWITGMLLAKFIYGGLSINLAFTFKVLGAAIVLLSSCVSNFYIYYSFKNKTPLNKKLMKTMVIMGRLGLLAALVGAAIAFN